MPVAKPPVFSLAPRQTSVRVGTANLMACALLQKAQDELRHKGPRDPECVRVAYEGNEHKTFVPIQLSR
jgi:hypothetical protein